jgi:hypothetical protein
LRRGHELRAPSVRWGKRDLAIIDLHGIDPLGNEQGYGLRHPASLERCELSRAPI